MAVKIRCMVVDDEPLARRVLAKHIASVRSLTLAAECGSAEEAAAILHENAIDLMFLDVRMPGVTGLDLLKTLTDPPKVILTTAHSEYALAGYEYSVVDYLLKPISFERFLKAVNKLTPHVTSEPSQLEFATRPLDSIFLRADRVDHKVFFDEISYLESYGNFVKVHLDRGMILVAKTMAAFEKMLPAELFLRVHRSFIVSLSRIDVVGRGNLRIDDVRIPIGRSYRREVARVVRRRLRGAR